MPPSRRSRTGSRRRTVAMFLEPLVEPRFHQDSYGYRPRKLGP